MKYLYVYPEKCTGCKECAMACSLNKFGECNPKKSAITIVRDEFERYEYPIVCVQCDDPICITICPQNALKKEIGIKRNEDKCIGCRMCAVLCPYSAITVIRDKLVQCDLCDGSPICIKYCSTNAIVYEEETKELSKRRKDLAKKILSLKEKIN